MKQNKYGMLEVGVTIPVQLLQHKSRTSLQARSDVIEVDNTQHTLDTAQNKTCTPASERLIKFQHFQQM